MQKKHQDSPTLLEGSLAPASANTLQSLQYFTKPSISSTSLKGLSFCLSRTFCNILLLIQTKLEPKLIMIVHQEEDKVCFSIVHLFPLKNRNKQVKIFLFFIRSVSDVFDTKHEVPFSNLFFFINDYTESTSLFDEGEATSIGMTLKKES